MVIDVSADGAVLADRPALVSVSEALSGAGDAAFTLASSGAVLEVSSQRPVRSPRFEPRAEAALATSLRDVAATLPGAHSGVVAVEEFRGPWGVPDLAALAPARVQQRLSTDVPPLLSQHDCRLVVAAGRWTEPAALLTAARVSQAAGARYLRRLVAIGALDLRNGRVRRNPGLVTLGRLWAIEAKVDDWQSGLAQAHRYRLWADGAVLVLGRARVPARTIAEHARRYRVGVVIDGQWIARARPLAPDAATRLHASEHMLAALIGATPGRSA